MEELETQEVQEEQVSAAGITLPDDAPGVEALSGTERLLGFDEAGEPVTATAQQLKEFANEGMAVLVPFSLEEQAVPGEFWMDVGGVQRQVYIRTFRGTISGSTTQLVGGIDSAMLVQGYMVQKIHHMPFNAVFPFGNITTAFQAVAIPYVTNGILTIYTGEASNAINSAYVATFKYTKS